MSGLKDEQVYSRLIDYKNMLRDLLYNHTLVSNLVRMMVAARLGRRNELSKVNPGWVWLVVGW